MLRDLRMDNVILQRMHSAMNIFRFQYIPMWYLMPLEGGMVNLLIHRFGLVLCAFLLMGLVAVPAAFALKLNEPAPDFVLNNLNGEKVSLARYRGKVVILNFWSTTCAPCLEEIPSLSLLQVDFRGLYSE